MSKKNGGCKLKKRLFNFLLPLVFVTTIFSGLVPSEYVQAAPNDQPKIVGKTAITMDVQTGEIIYAQGIDEKMYPASVTKIMTGLLFAENKQKSDLIPYTESAKAQPAYALSTDLLKNKIKVGDTMTAEDVMEALLLFSANDSAYMVADSVAGNSTNFIKMMNDRAAKLGLKNTNFVTANGIDDKIDNHLTTAYDLTVIGREAYKNPWIKETIATKKSKLETSTGVIAYVENRNKLLGQNGAVGGKTGYTSKAGRCLLAFYERDGRTIVGVVMKSEYDAQDSQVFKDMETIINWSYDAKRVKVYDKGATVKTETLTYKPLRFFGPEKTIEVPLMINDEVSYYENSVNKAELKTEISTSNLDPWNLTAETKVGKLTAQQREVNTSYDLYTTVTSKDLMAANKSLYFAAGAGAFVAIVAILFILFLISRGLRKGNKKQRFR
jgi:D-alanyl-D-alanine carboxypeptidase